MGSALLWRATAMCLCAPLVFCYTNPEGIRLLQDLRIYKGDEAPVTWVGPDPCGSQWEGVECSPEGRVLNVALPSWLPHRTLLQDLPPLSQKAVDTVKTAVQVAGIVGQTSDAIGSTFPAGSPAQDSSHNAVAPTVSVIQGSLESLLQPPQLSEPASLAAPSPLPPHVWKASTAASMLTGVPLPSSAVMSPKVSAPSVIGNDASAPAPGSVHATLAPSTAPHSQPLPSAESTVKLPAKPAAEPAPQQKPAEASGPEANPGEALVELLMDLEAIKVKLAEQGVRRRLTAHWWQVPPPPPPFPPPPINYNPPSPIAAGSGLQEFAATVPLPADEISKPAPALAPTLAPALTPIEAPDTEPPAQLSWPTPSEAPLAAVEVPAPAQPEKVRSVITAAALAPKHAAINPQLLPQGGTDIAALQQAVDSNMEGTATTFGRRLREYYSFGSPATAPSGGPSAGPGPAISNPFILAPESAPTGEPVEVFRKNADGSITFTLPQGNIGDFVLPQITGSIPSNLKGQVVPQPIPVGRKLLAAQWWQVPPPPPPMPPPPPPPPFPPPPISPPPPPGRRTPTVKPAETLLSFPDAQTSINAAAKAPAAEGPVATGPSPAQYEDTLAPEIAPAGESSPTSLQYDLPALKIGPVTLPELKGLLPTKTAISLPGRKRLSEIVPAVAPTPSAAAPSWEILAPELAPTGEASPNGDFTLPALNLGGFRLPDVNLGKLLPLKKPLP